MNTYETLNERYDPLEQAREHGTKAAIAQNQHDAARVNHWRDYHRRWLAYQPESERKMLDEAYRQAYTEARVIR